MPPNFVFHAFLKPFLEIVTSQITALEAFYAKTAEILHITNVKLFKDVK